MGAHAGVGIRQYKLNEYGLVFHLVDCSLANLGIAVLPPGFCKRFEHRHSLITQNLLMDHGKVFYRVLHPNRIDITNEGTLIFPYSPRPNRHFAAFPDFYGALAGVLLAYSP
jgi:hypothetical protein